MSLPEYGPQARPVVMLEGRPTHGGEGNVREAENIVDLTSETSSRSSARPAVDDPTNVGNRRHITLVPSGFECVAHPVFFRTEPLITSPAASAVGVDRFAARDTATSNARQRRRPQSRRFQPERTSTSPSITSFEAPWDRDDVGEHLATLGSDGIARNNRRRSSNDLLEGRSQREHQDRDTAGEIADDGRAATLDVAESSRYEREVDVICPICLGKFEEPVTLTTCLHTFCHTCILGWFQHTVAVALARGHLSAFDETAGSLPDGSYIDSATNNGSRNRGSKSPVPYRCPLCQIPGPYFLAVEPAAPRATAALLSSKASEKNKEKVRTATDKELKKQKEPKLKFRLLGARTVFGGGGPASGGVEVDCADDDRGDARRGRLHGTGYPSMVELRAAARAQLALAAAVSASEKQVKERTAVSTVGPAIAREVANGRKGESEGGSVTVSVAEDTHLGSSSASCTGKKRQRSSDRAVRGAQDGIGAKREPSENPARAASIALNDDDDRERDTCVRAGGSRDGDRQGRRRGHPECRRDRRESIRKIPPHGKRQSRDRGRDDRDDNSESLSVGEGAGMANTGDKDGDHGEVSADHRTSDLRRLIGSEGRRSSSRSSRDDHGRKRRRKRRREESTYKDRTDSNLKATGADEHLDRTITCRRNRGELPWEPGSMPAEDALQAIEAMLEREKESLRRRTEACVE